MLKPLENFKNSVVVILVEVFLFLRCVVQMGMSTTIATEIQTIRCFSSLLVDVKRYQRLGFLRGPTTDVTYQATFEQT